MKTPSLETVGQAVGLGVVAGMRSMAAPAILGGMEALQGKKGALAKTPFKAMCTPPAAGLLGVLAAGEMVMDKMPGMIDRTSLPALAGRVGAGALVGAAVFSCAKQKSWLGALIGAASAVGAAYGTLYLRKYATEKLKVPNPIAGAVEDALAIAGEAAIVKTMK